MKLNKTQIKELKKYEWTPVEANDDQHGVWVSVTPADGVIFGEIFEGSDTNRVYTTPYPVLTA